MEYVPAKDSAYQWETLFEGMYNKNKTFNINEISLERESVTGIPPNVTDLQGQPLVPKEAANVDPPKPITPPDPSVYKDTVPLGTAERVDEMGRPIKQRRTRRKPKRKKSTRKGVAKKKATKKRSRSSIVKK